MKTWLLLALLPLGGCMAGPDYARPAVALNPDWSAANDRVPEQGPWWRIFADPTLDTLERAALSGNLDVEAAIARIETARAGLRAAQAALLPAGELNGTAARAQQSLNAGLGQLSRFVPDLPRTVNRAQLNVSGSWDLDFAGGNRRRRQMAAADLFTRDAELAAVRLAITGEVADAYLALRGAQAQHRALQAHLTLIEDRHAIMAARLNAGVVPASALNDAAAARDAARAIAAPLEAEIAAHRNRLAVLLGRAPGAEVAEIGTAGDLPVATDPAAGIPADILRQRPDVRAAESRLAAATAGIGVAISEYYPSLSLSGLIGLDSNRFGNLIQNDSGVIQGALGLRWRLFDFGRIDAEVLAARGRKREALAAYRAAVLRASEDVETGFSQLSATRARLASLLSRRDELAAAAMAARKAYDTGLISRDAMIQPQVPLALLDAEIASARVDHLRAAVACARALGGATDAD